MAPQIPIEENTITNDENNYKLKLGFIIFICIYVYMWVKMVPKLGVKKTI